MGKRSVLGKGINALIPEYPEPRSAEEGSRQIIQLRIEEIEPNPHQARTVFDEGAISELRRSIEEKGVIQPVTVHRLGHSYQLITGERRWRATKLAGYETIPAIIYELDSQQELMELALIENIQREDLSPIEEAEGYRTLLNTCYLTQEEVAQRVGKDRSTITNLMRLLNLPVEIQDNLKSGALQMGHARALLGLEDDGDRVDLARRCIVENMSVREVEKAVSAGKSDQGGRRGGRKKPRDASGRSGFDAMVTAFEEQLQVRYGTAVNIRKGSKKGRIEIEFYDDGDLERLLELLLDESG